MKIIGIILGLFIGVGIMTILYFPIILNHNEHPTILYKIFALLNICLAQIYGVYTANKFYSWFKSKLK